MGCYECRYGKEKIPEDKLYCGKSCLEVSDEGYEDDFDCKDFEIFQSCSNCKHGRQIIYETGTIDDIEYRCKLQNNKLMYDDCSPFTLHNADFPICNIKKYEESK